MTIPIDIQYRSTGANDVKRESDEVKTSLNGVKGGATGAAGAFAAAGPIMAGALATVAVAAIAAKKAVDLLTSAFSHLIEEGSRVAPIATAFNAIAGPGTLQALRQASDGLIERASLMSNFTRIMRVGIVNEQEYGRMLAQTTRLAQQHGIQVGRATDALAEFLSGGGTESLRVLGVNVLEINERLQSMGLSAETTRGRIEAFRLATEQMRRGLNRTGEDAVTVGDAWQRLAVQISDYISEISEAVAQNPRFISLLSETRDVLEDILPEPGRIAEEIDALSEKILELAASLSSTIRPLTTVTTLLLRLHAVSATISSGGVTLLTGYTQAVWNLADAMDGAAGRLDRALVSIRNNIRGLGIDTGTADRPGGRPTGDLDLPDIIRRIVGRGRRAPPQRGDTSEDILRAYEHAVLNPLPGPPAGGGGAGRPAIPAPGGQRPPGPDLEAAALKILEEQDAAERRRLQTAEAQLRAGDKELVLRQRILDIQQRMTETGDRQMLNQSREAKSRQLAAESYEVFKVAQAAEVKAMGTVTGLWQQHLNFQDTMIDRKVASGQIDEKEAVRQKKRLDAERKAVGAFLAIQAFIQAAFAFAEIPKAIATGGPLGIANAVLLGVSGAAYIAAGIMSLTQLGGTATPPGKTSSAAPPPKKKKDRPHGEGLGASGQIIVANFSSGRLARELGKARKRASKVGVPMGMGSDAGAERF